LFLFSVASDAQPPQGTPNFAQMRQSPMMQQAMKNSAKAAFRSLWDGRSANLIAFGLMQDADIRTALGVSNEQFQEMQGIPMQIGAEMQNNPEHQKIIEEMKTLQDPNDPFMQNASEETQRKFQDIQGRMIRLSMDIMTDSIDKVITPDQKQKMNEALLANMAEMPIASTYMFEALDLTDAQRQQMGAIKQELEPEFEKNLEDFANNSLLIANMMFDEAEKQGGDLNNPAGLQERMMQTAKTLAENPEFKRIQKDMETKGKAFSVQFNTKMFDVLTDDQWKRLQNLIDNPPAHAKAFGKKLQEQKAASEKGGAWQPGPNSWRPGDAIPEQYRQQRNERRRFPQTEE